MDCNDRVGSSHLLVLRPELRSGRPVVVILGEMRRERR
jgi:hypothetical protein